MLGAASFALYIAFAPSTVFGEQPTSETPSPPKIDHILLEVSDLNVSIAFYRDFVGLRLKSRSTGQAQTVLTGRWVHLPLSNLCEVVYGISQPSPRFRD
jgi:hypothetical protein